MDDLISRRAAIKAIDDLPNCDNGYSDTYDKAYIIGVLEELPTAEPKHGRWIDDGSVDYNPRYYFCSVCGESSRDVVGWEWCPYCGAKMEE